VLLRLAYLGVATVFALLRLLPMSSRDNDAEILALRHQLSVVQRQLGPSRVRFTPGDGVRMPGMNSIMERWVQTCQRELLDRTLIWNQAHLLHALRESGQFYNGHRPHQGIANARPLQPLPVPLVVPGQIASLDIRRRDRLGGVLHEYQHAA
jgi:putative transposase